jgi:TPR repeat protein
MEEGFSFLGSFPPFLRETAASVIRKNSSYFPESDSLLKKGNVHLFIDKLKKHWNSCIKQKGNWSIFNFLSSCKTLSITFFTNFFQEIKQKVRSKESFYPFVYGICLEIGLGTSSNESEAVKYYQIAAKKKNSDALLNLGYCYDMGIFFPENSSKAVSYYMEGAKLGNVRAMNNYAVMLRDGEGVPRDISKAIRLFQEIANFDCLSAYNLSQMYTKGKHTKANSVEATRLLKLSSDQGHEPAMYECAISNLNGF